MKLFFKNGNNSKSSCAVYIYLHLYNDNEHKKNEMEPMLSYNREWTQWVEIKRNNKKILNSNSGKPISNTF